jgi:hypothetical protein
MVNLQALLKSRPAIEFLLGLCIGLSCSMVFSPFVNDLCNTMSLGSSANDAQSELVFEDSAVHTDAKKQVKSRPTRPRFVNTELGIREKIFFGVLSTGESLETRAIAINTTINSDAMKLAFFLTTAGMQSGSVQSQLPLVLFSDNSFVEDALWFHSFRYVGERYLNTFDWFFFIQDRSYISASNIVSFVDRISVAGNHLIGKPIKHSSNGATTCDTSAGVLMSNVS